MKKGYAGLIGYTLGKSYTVAYLIIVSVGLLVETWREVGNLQDFTECLKFLLKQLRNVTKVGTVLVHKKKILNLMKIVEDGYYVKEKELSQEEIELTRKSMENARRFSYINWFQWFMTLVLETSINQQQHEMSGHNSTEEMPIKLWIPFPTRDPALHQLGLVYDILFALSASWFSAVTDTLIFTFLIHMTSQFEMLGNSLKKMGDEIPPDMNSQQPSKQFKIPFYKL